MVEPTMASRIIGTVRPQLPQAHDTFDKNSRCITLVVKQMVEILKYGTSLNEEQARAAGKLAAEIFTQLEKWQGAATPNCEEQGQLVASVAAKLELVKTHKIELPFSGDENLPFLAAYVAGANEYYLSIGSANAQTGLLIEGICNVRFVSLYTRTPVMKERAAALKTYLENPTAENYANLFKK